MKIFALILSLFFCFRADANDSFYIWQQQWSDQVLAAVSGEDPTTFYPLVAVVPERGGSSLVEIPWETLAASKHRFVPVIRIPLKAFKRDDLFSELVSLTDRLAEQMGPIVMSEIQFDLDCPERLLERYVELAEKYSAHFPAVRLSITALPCHLKHDAFRRLAALVDFYVLQVHGIEVPKHADETVFLLNMSVAEKAIEQAEKIGLPFVVALPCYAYELNFDNETGAFLFLTAEKTTRRTDTLKRRTAARNQDLVTLCRSVKALNREVVWFRLPVVGDRLCLPRKTLAAIQKGAEPSVEVECRIIQINPTTIELELCNENTIEFCRANVTLDWPNPAGIYDLFHATATARELGNLPRELSVIMPPPGESVKLGWFQSATTNHPKIKLDLK